MLVSPFGAVHAYVKAVFPATGEPKAVTSKSNASPGHKITGVVLRSLSKLGSIKTSTVSVPVLVPSQLPSVILLIVYVPAVLTSNCCTLPTDPVDV